MKINYFPETIETPLFFLFPFGLISRRSYLYYLSSSCLCFQTPDNPKQRAHLTYIPFIFILYS